jgi:hypothetical protein
MINPTNIRILRELFRDHDLLGVVGREDATVYAWMKQFEHDRCTLNEMFIGIIIGLTAEKKKYFEEVVKLNMKYGPKESNVNKNKIGETEL